MIGAIRRVIYVVVIAAACCSGAFAEERDTALLNELQRCAFEFFWDQASPSTGLVKDRAGNFADDDHKVASIAATGFGLAALPVACERKWINHVTARDRALTTLKFFAEKAEHERGFFYHFLGFTSAKRASGCELSSIDTALLLAGVIVVREYFQDDDVTRYANLIYDRVDFDWMLNGGKTFSMGWKPEGGFLRERWWDYNESILIILLALGSRTHPVGPEVWHALHRKKGVYRGITVIQSPPLFTHQYAQLYFDFRDKHDDYADYFSNSRNAAICNMLFCRSEADKYSTYRKGYWGLTASDGPNGYKAYGAKPGGALSDGTVAPTAAIASVMFTPHASLRFMQELYTNEKRWLWGYYGFSDAFNIDEEWNSPDVIGIDQGPILLGIENYRTGLIWRLFSGAPEVELAFRKAG
ncbi:MAG TPA: glucoamylase family protein, partial [bacterium]|nr:glucoamylase family protein [bacterium]